MYFYVIVDGYAEQVRLITDTFSNKRPDGRLMVVSKSGAVFSIDKADIASWLFKDDADNIHACRSYDEALVEYNAEDGVGSIRKGASPV